MKSTSERQQSVSKRNAPAGKLIDIIDVAACDSPRIFEKLRDRKKEKEIIVDDN